MGYAVLHLDKARGTDAGMSAHIERTITPANVDPSRTHLNRELIEFPEGVANRTEAIQYRLDHAGLTRKIGTNQVRAIRLILTGSRKDMERIEQAGLIDKWCADNLDWLGQTYGAENIVSAVLHMDETSPHIHATLIPIVTGERRKAKKEQEQAAPGKKRYRKKKPEAARLCTDDVMARPKLKSYQDTYAQAMQQYGLKRGIEGSEAKHITGTQFYKDVFLRQDEIREEVQTSLRQKEAAQEQVAKLTQQQDNLSESVADLYDRRDEARQKFEDMDRHVQEKTEELERTKQEIGSEREQAQKELTKIRSEIKTDKLKCAAVEATTKAVERVGSLFNDPKAARYEKQIADLTAEKAVLLRENNNLNEQIGSLQTRHEREKEQLKKETEGVRSELNHIHSLFPHIRGLLRWENYLKAIGLTLQWIKALFTLRPCIFTGSLTSPEFRRPYHAQDTTLQFHPDKNGPGGLRFTIGGIDDCEWFRQRHKEQMKSLGVDLEQIEKRNKKITHRF